MTPEIIAAMELFTPETLPPRAAGHYVEAFSYIKGQSQADGVHIPFEQIEFQSMRHALWAWMEYEGGAINA